MVGSDPRVGAERVITELAPRPNQSLESGGRFRPPWHIVRVSGELQPRRQPMGWPRSRGTTVRRKPRGCQRLACPLPGPLPLLVSRLSLDLPHLLQPLLLRVAPEFPLITTNRRPGHRWDPHSKGTPRRASSSPDRSPGTVAIPLPPGRHASGRDASAAGPAGSAESRGAPPLLGEDLSLRDGMPARS